MKKDSKEEGYFIDYLEELKDFKIVKSYKRAKSFNLINPVEREYSIEKKDKLEFKKFKLLNEHIYTPDFEIEFSKSILGFMEGEYGLSSSIKDKNKTIFVGSEKIAFVEIKADYVNSNELRCFKINQKLLYEKYGIYVNLIQIPKLFKHTFTPVTYLFTEKKKQLKKLNYDSKSVKEFLLNVQQ